MDNIASAPDYKPAIKNMHNYKWIDIVDEFNEYIAGTEWKRRWNECKMWWLDHINLGNISGANKNDDDKNNICLYNIDDKKGGIGNKMIRQSIGFFVTSISNCKLSINWGWPDDKCIDPKIANSNSSINPKNLNIFAFIFENNPFFTSVDIDSNSRQRLKGSIAHHEITGLSQYYVTNQWRRYNSDNNKIYNLNENSYCDNDNTNSTGTNNVCKKLIFPKYLAKDEWMFLFDKYNYKKNCTLETYLTLIHSTYKDHYKYGMIDDYFIKHRIGKRFFNIRARNAHMEYLNIQQYFGLLVKYLKFKYRLQAIQFIENNFKNSFVIGIHLRLGNGEIFTKYHRDIANIYEIVDQFGMIMVTLLNMNNINSTISLKNIKIFIATDTLNAIDILSNLLMKNFNLNKNQIVHLSQLNAEMNNRVPNGAGHLYSLSDRITDNKTLIKNKIDCVSNIGYTYLDSEILGFTDMLILPIGSTFTRLSRLLMIKREKILCVARTHSPSFANWYCEDFAKTQSWKIRFVKQRNPLSCIQNINNDDINQTLPIDNVMLTEKLKKCNLNINTNKNQSFILSSPEDLWNKKTTR